MAELLVSFLRTSIFEKTLDAAITCDLLGIGVIKMIYQHFVNRNYQNSGPEAPTSGYGGNQGTFEGVLRHLGPSWTFFGKVLDVLEASWKRLGGLLGRLGPKKMANIVGSQKEAKSNHKSI